MTDLRKAAEQALKYFEDAYGVDVIEFEIKEALRQALAQDALRKLAEIDHELGLYVDAVNISAERVDETAKREHEPEWVATIGNWGKVQWREDVFPQLGAKLYSAPPKREWVGLTRRELDIATLGLEDLGDCYKAIEAKLKEKNT